MEEEDGLLGEIVQFVEEVPKHSHQDRLRTGLIAFGPDTRLQTRLLERWRSTQSQKNAAIVVKIDSTQTSNLMTALKNVIRTAIIQLDGVQGYQVFLDARKRKIPMNYDLELLQEFAAARDVQKCVICLTDIESFDIVLLTDFLSVINAWKDRIPFILLIGISTTVDLFEARLPKSTIQLLDCTLFDVSKETHPYLQMYQSSVGKLNALTLSLGPVVSNTLAEMAREQDTSAGGYRRAIKYATMSHFFANALAVFLDPEMQDEKPDREICEAIRSTDSFRAFTEEELKRGNGQVVRSLLSDDEALLRAAKEAVHVGQEAMCRHRAAATLFETVLRSITPPDVPLDSFSIQIQALSGTSFLDSTTYTELISSITTLPSDGMRGLLATIQQHTDGHDIDVDALQQKLNHIAPPTLKAPLRSAYDPRHTTTSTTITNNKVSLAKHGPKLSAAETAYTRLVDEVVATLSTHWATHIRDPRTLFMHEAFVYDLKSPLAAVFGPRPRFATERALSSPADYLGCACCGGRAEGRLAASQPPTSVLWQLWCEAGGVVNVRDLWNAFSAIVVDRRGEGEEDGEEEEEEKEGGKGRTHEEEKEEEEKEAQANGGGHHAAAPVSGRVDERTALALFYRGLAELGMLGFVKATKRKMDCLAKTAWKGL